MLDLDHAARLANLKGRVSSARQVPIDEATLRTAKRPSDLQLRQDAAALYDPARYDEINPDAIRACYRAMSKELLATGKAAAYMASPAARYGPLAPDLGRSSRRGA